jgi:chromosomal replication initiation ATPase DnaA
MNRCPHCSQPIPIKDDRERMKAVLEYHAKLNGVSLTDALSKRRGAGLRARHATWADLRKSGWSYLRIGRVAGVDHSTVINALSPTRKQRRKEPARPTSVALTNELGDAR